MVIANQSQSAQGANPAASPPAPTDVGETFSPDIEQAIADAFSEYAPDNGANQTEATDDSVDEAVGAEQEVEPEAADDSSDENPTEEGAETEAEADENKAEAESQSIPKTRFDQVLSKNRQLKEQVKQTEQQLHVVQQTLKEQSALVKELTTRWVSKLFEEGATQEEVRAQLDEMTDKFAGKGVEEKLKSAVDSFAKQQEIQAAQEALQEECDSVLSMEKYDGIVSTADFYAMLRSTNLSPKEIAETLYTKRVNAMRRVNGADKAGASAKAVAATKSSASAPTSAAKPKPAAKPPAPPVSKPTNKVQPSSGMPSTEEMTAYVEKVFGKKL